MIFGFNTDIKSGNTIYHVQSEARQNERLLQTQIFVRGHCIAKKAVSYADLVGQPEFSETRMHEMLKSQHRQTVEDLRAGHIDEAFTNVQQASETANGVSEGGATIGPPDARLALEFVNSTAVLAGETVQLRFRVLEGERPVSGAKLISKLTSSSNGEAQEPVFVQVVTENDGYGEFKLPIRLDAGGDATVLVQATHQGKSATKKFRLTK